MAELSVPTRLTLSERDLARHELELVDHENQITSLRIDVAKIGVRLAIWAGLGSFLGGSFFAVLIAYIR